MDVYRQAGAFLQELEQGRSTAKALCLAKQTQKKKQTFAVLSETFRNLKRIKQVLKDAEFFEYFPAIGASVTDRYVCYCMVFDALYGKGINTRQSDCARAVTESLAFLQKADAALPRFVRVAIPFEELDEDAVAGNEGDGAASAAKATAAAEGQRLAVSLPRYARFSSLILPFSREEQQPEAQKLDAKAVGDIADALFAQLSKQQFRRSNISARQSAGKRRERAENGEEADAAGDDEHDGVVRDKHIPHLFVFPSGTDLHSHPLVKRGTLILQDKSSCIPAAVLCAMVPVQPSWSSSSGDAGEEQQRHDHLSGLVVDGCAAPGNKTSQLAEYCAMHRASAPAAQRREKLVAAIEKDDKRYALLQGRMQALGVAALVDCQKGFFQDLFCDAGSEKNREVTAILLDPSCSSSGVVSRIDVATRNGASAASSETALPADDARVVGLANAQLELLCHALTQFPNCRRVVFSTCSIHQRENEDNVLKALSFANRTLAAAAAAKEGGSKAKQHKQKAAAAAATVSGGEWTVSRIMPATWSTRGRIASPITPSSKDGTEVAFTEEEQQRIASNCIRCDPERDQTSGFFVACFERPAQ